MSVSESALKRSKKRRAAQEARQCPISCQALPQLADPALLTPKGLLTAHPQVASGGVHRALAKDRLERLLDLYVDCNISDRAYHAKKQSLEISIGALTEELANMPDIDQYELERMDFLELMENLAGLYIKGGDTEKREIVENAFSNRQVVEEKIYLKPSKWLRTGELHAPVLYGGDDRDTSRTFGDVSGDAIAQDIKKRRLIALLRTARREKNV